MPHLPSFPARSRPGFTLVELLVVITVIAILASMSMPIINIAQEMARKARCANNQKGIFTALLAYQEGGEAGWPDARKKLGIDQSGGVSAALTIAGSERGAQYTAAIFELLAASQKGSLPDSIFRCPSNTGPAFRPNPELQPSLTRPGTDWGWGSFRIPYAMDWSAPADSGAARVLIGDRDPMNHKDKAVVVCYADGHTRTLNRLRDATGPGWMAGQGPDFSRGLMDDLKDVVIVNPEIKGAVDAGDADITPDNIFDNFGDFPQARGPDRTRTPGAGDAGRCSLK